MVEIEDRRQALKQHLKLDSVDEIKDGYNEQNFETDEGEFMVLTDEEADELWEEDLENYLDDCILPDLPDTAQRYFDRESWKRDARFDGRGHSLNRYDGSEEWEEVNGVTLYIYRTN